MFLMLVSRLMRGFHAFCVKFTHSRHRPRTFPTKGGGDGGDKDSEPKFSGRVLKPGPLIASAAIC